MLMIILINMMQNSGEKNDTNAIFYSYLLPECMAHVFLDEKRALQ